MLEMLSSDVPELVSVTKWFPLEVETV
jgi:hypothetical protein